MGRVSALSEQVSGLQGAVHQKAERAALQEQESRIRELGEAVLQQAEEATVAARSATCRREEQTGAMERLAEGLGCCRKRWAACRACLNGRLPSAHPELACAAVLTPAAETLLLQFGRPNLLAGRQLLPERSYHLGRCPPIAEHPDGSYACCSPDHLPLIAACSRWHHGAAGSLQSALQAALSGC